MIASSANKRAADVIAKSGLKTVGCLEVEKLQLLEVFK